MKKFVVGLLTVFMMLGASILYACGSPKVELELSNQNISIQLNGENDPVSTVNAIVSSTDDKSVSLDFTLDNGVASASLSQTEDGQNVITITGLSEGQTELVVTTKQGNVKKSVYIDVYSEVTSMTEKIEDVQNKSNKFVVKGQTNLLVAENLIDFYPSSSNKKDVSWTFEANGALSLDGAEIVGQSIIIPEEFRHNEIVLMATTHLGVSTTVTIACLDPIDVSSLDLGGAKTLTGAFEYLSNGNVTIEITPNIAIDNENLAYLAVRYLGDLANSELEISPVVFDGEGSVSTDLYVVSEQINSNQGLYIFRAFADSSKSVNDEFQVSFNIGYKNYNYQVNSDQLGYGRVVVDAKEKINSISITKNEVDASFSEQTLYSQYSQNFNSGFGQLYKISLSPDTVIGVSGKYQISISVQGLNIKSNLPPLKAYVRVSGAYREINFYWDINSASYLSEEIESTSNKILEHEVYLKASQEFFDAEQNAGNDITTLSGIKVIFVSVDNKDVSSQLTFKIIKSLGEINFAGEVEDISIDSSYSQIISKEFVLLGQTTIEGLSVVSSSQFVDISEPKYISNDGNNVRFSIEFTLKPEYIGLTDSNSYFVLSHENGAESQPIYLNIYFPLTDASILVDNTSSSVTMYQSSNQMFVDGEETLGSLSNSVLMLKNGATYFINHIFNVSANSRNSAQASVSLSFYDFNVDTSSEISEQEQLRQFLSLLNSTLGRQTILANANVNASNIVSSNNVLESFRTTSVGYTYLVFTYEGIGNGGQNVSLQRIVLVHSYNAIESFSVSPSTDREFSLYASNSVGQADEVIKTVRVVYSSNDISYFAKNNFTFKTMIDNISLVGKIDEKKCVVWYIDEPNTETRFDGNRYFEIIDVEINGKYIDFTVVALSTEGMQSSLHNLTLEYSISSEDALLNVVELNQTTQPYIANIAFVIKNADRVEEVVVDGVDENGLYFEIGQPDKSSQTIIVKTSPSNAKDSSIKYLIVDENGNQSQIVSISSVGSQRLKVDLSSTVTEGVNGTLYLFPSDAVFNDKINYQYLVGESILSDSISLNKLFQIKDNNQTYFEWLVENAFFVNNQGENVYFKDFLISIDINIADGRDFEHAYRVYDQTGFTKGDYSNSYYYTVMNDISLDSNWKAFGTFSGGLQGLTEDVTITFNTCKDDNGIIQNNKNNFASVLEKDGIIKNISFNGNVLGLGFVVDQNNGTITNVTVDTNGLYSSSLSSLILSGESSVVGGVAGTNNGTISNVYVLGLTILAENGTIGGVVGLNNGEISQARVEFYRLLGENESAYYNNYFKGNIVGGVIGQQAKDATISQIYAYDYILLDILSDKEDSQNRLQGQTIGTLIGAIDEGVNVTISESFAFVDNFSTKQISSEDEEQTIIDFVGQGNVKISCSYISYYNENTEYQSYFSNDFNNDVNSDKVVTSADTEFNTNINQGNSYLRNFYQDEKISSVTASSNSVVKDDQTGLYKAIVADENSIVFFRSSIFSNSNNLTTSQSQDYREINSLQFKDLLSDDNQSYKNLVASSSTNNLVTSGSEIYIQSVGSGTLSIYSKQDVKVKTTYNFVVEKALSDLIVTSKNSSAQDEEFTKDNQKTVNLQKSKSKEFIVDYKSASVYLGTDASEFELDMISSFELYLQGTASQVQFTQTSNTSFNAVSQGENSLTGTISAKLTNAYDDEGSTTVYQDAVKENVGVNITIKPVDGAIALGFDGDEISISPSTTKSVTASMMTTSKDDNISLEIALVGPDDNEISLSLDPDTSGENSFNFVKPDGQVVLTITRQDLTDDTAYQNDESSNVIYNKSYLFTFTVASDYKSKLSSDETYLVNFISDSKFVSEKFILNLSRQDISKVDITNNKIDDTSYNSSKTTYKTLSTTTGVMAPGSSSIIHASVNPDFAYYDFLEVTVENAPISNAVVFTPVEKDSSVSNTYYSTSAIVFEQIANGFRFVPSNNSNLAIYKYNLYFHAWFNNKIPQDCTLTIKITYYVYNEKGEAEAIDYVNSFIFVSYLSEPTITIDGQNSVLLAKGGSANVEVAVDLDQEVESVNISGAVGIDYISNGTRIDDKTNKRIYSYTLYSTVLSSTESTDNRFYVNATVIRRLNNTVERKTTTATVTLVDFKIDANKSYLERANDGVLDVYVNINQTTSLNYVFNPETLIYDSSDEASRNAYNSIMEKRQQFESNHYYPMIENGQIAEDGEGNPIATGDYLINIKATKNSDGTTSYEPIKLEDRIYYVTGNTYVPINGASEEKSPFTINVDNNGNINIRAKSLTQASQQMVILTYIETNGEQQIVETFFTIKTEIYSDEDLPIMVKSAEDFLSLQESEDNLMHDYILMNDIVLDNYSPFDTNFISSFDGNGHTIFIRSFKTTAEENSHTLNIALFNNVNALTTLKNVRVNLYNGGNITVDVSNNTTNYVSNINIAGFAITNNGIITNCEVVAFYTDRNAIGQSGLSEVATNKESGAKGLNISYIRGSGTSEEVMQEASSWDSKVAGFVINNNGNITNSRVGGDEVLELLDAPDPNDTNNNQITGRYTKLETFTIKAQGQVAGFVLENRANISASYVKNLAMQNNSKTANENKAYCAGFVGSNSGKILTSYVEGVKQTSSSDEQIFARLGSQIKSQQCVISGFVLTNLGDSSLIEDSYSNILISSSDNVSEVYLASGFVYRNEGKVSNCYSASQVENQKYSQMNFSGLDAEGNLLASGEYENCYYYNKDYDPYNSTSDSSTETAFDTDVILVPDAGNEDYFYGLAIASAGGVDGVWVMDVGDGQTAREGLKLIEADTISYSYRYANYTERNSDGSVNINGEYQLPYGIIYIENSNLEINTEYGSDQNPIIIRNAEEFVEVMGASSSTPIQKQYENTIHGTYRLVDDIDMSKFSSQAISLPSTKSAFSGKLYGNGFTISSLSLSYNGQNLSYGLFKSIEPYFETASGDKVKEYYPQIINLNFEISSNLFAGDTIFVGTVAGYIKDALLINIDLSYSNGALVQGKNFVGSLAGMITGNSVIKNITVSNPNIQTTRLTSQSAGIDTSYSQTEINDNRKGFVSQLSYNYNFTGSDTVYLETEKYSYAGGVAGYVDLYSSAVDYFNYTTTPIYNVSNIRVNETVNVIGQVVGGLFGLTAHQTFIEDAGLTIDGTSTSNTSHIVSTKDYAGGVIGQSFGLLSKIFATHDDEIQLNIENNIASYYNGSTNVERGALDLFMTSDSGNYYSQQAIGGLIGQVGAGALQTSYSKLNVISTTAVSAGGIIGETDLSGSISYYVDNNIIATGQYTKYLVYEVYATGDVRAYYDDDADSKTTPVEGMSGGIIGYISQATDRVAFLSTNAVNFFTNIDYRTGENYQSDFSSLNNETEEEIANYIFQFVGGIVDKGNLSTAVSFWTARNVNTNTDGSSETTEQDTQNPSVGYVQSYLFNDKEIFVNLYPGCSLRANQNNNKSLYEVESISTYFSGTAGYQATQKIFLNSGVWSLKNWVHSADRFFPEIRYALSDPSYVYLDAYEESILYALNRAKENPTITIIVRGLKNANTTDSYTDVDLIQYQNRFELTSFAGSIISSSEYTTKDPTTNSIRQIRLIIEDSLFKSTAIGFSITDLHIQYEAEANDQKSLSGGIISANAIEGANITNLSIFMKTGVTIETKDGNAGLLAPKIISSQINVLNIDASQVQAGNTLSVRFKKTSAQELNVGLIAGVMSQQSSTASLYAQNVNITANSGSLIYFGENQALKESNVGLYFGKVEKDEGTYQSNFRLGDIDGNSEKIVGTINIENLDLSKTNNLRVGGYIGYVANATGIYFESQMTTAKINIKLPSNSTDGKSLYVGGIFGETSNENSSFALNSQSETPKKSIMVSVEGKVNPSNASITSIFSSAFVGGIVGKTESSLNILDIDLQFSAKNILVNGSSNTNVVDLAVGGIVGFSTNDISLEKITVKNNDGGINVQSVSNSATAIGSMVGYGTTTISSTQGQLYSSINIDYKCSDSENKNEIRELNIGGLFGYITNSDSAINSNINSNAYIGTMTIDLNNARNLYVGGIVGNLNSNTTFTNSVFGGNIIIKNPTSTIDKNVNVNVYVGGTIGYTNASFSIDNANNYGEVFIDYGDDGDDNDNKVDIISSYSFGGIVGHINSETSLVSVKNSNSAVTNHNARVAKTNNVNALVGSGTLKDSSTSNYYNSAVCLAYDTQGIDIGYSTASNNGFGTTSDSDFIINKIKSCVNKITNLGSFIKNYYGSTTNNNWYSSISKLNPSETFTDNGSDNSGYNVSYYTASKTLLSGLSDKTLSNVAIVGNFETFDFTKDNEDSEKSTTISTALINSLSSGYNMISGFNVKIDMTTNDASENVGGLVNTMSGDSIIYAVGVNGKMSIGGKNSVNVGGIVGVINSGIISESYTSIDMIYRAGAGGTMSAIANYQEKNSAFINYTYATGSVVSYSKASLYAFTSSASDNLTLNNCYTITKIDYNEYVTTTTPSTIGVFGSATTSNSYYDQNGLNYNFTNTNITQNQLTTSLLITVNEDSKLTNTNQWTTDINFNYGYPTRNFKYLKQSSWATRDEGARLSSTKNTYDYYIVTYSYTRLGNGESPTDTSLSYSYLVPNAGILAQTGTTTSTIYQKLYNKGVALLYDIDLANTQFANNWTSIYCSGNVFDGQDRTITGLKTSLFTALSSKEIRNLRLTEANSSTALLADEMSGDSTISNITLEGEISSVNSSSVGGLLNTMTGGEINTVTSLVKIQSDGDDAGGIVGYYYGTSGKISFCSNYGMITSSSSGGIVGETGTNCSLEINNCFNGGAILAGYTISEAKKVNYAAGGILGFDMSNGSTISNCYNAGMIKAGNKYNTAISYAAGIVGRAAHANSELEIIDGSATKITNCYNEGPVEALGADPQIQYKVTDDVKYNSSGVITSATNPKIQLVEARGRTVSAYSISNIAVTNCNDSNPEIKNNGAYLGIGGIYAEDKYLYMMKKTIAYNDYKYIYDIGSGLSQNMVFYGIDLNNTFRLTNEGITFNTLSYKQENFSVLEFDNYNLPLKFVETQSINVNWKLQDQWGKYFTINTTINRNYYYDLTNNVTSIDTFAYGSSQSTECNVSKNDYFAKQTNTNFVNIAGTSYITIEGNADEILDQSTSPVIIVGDVFVSDKFKLNYNLYNNNYAIISGAKDSLIIGQSYPKYTLSHTYLAGISSNIVDINNINLLKNVKHFGMIYATQPNLSHIGLTLYSTIYGIDKDENGKIIGADMKIGNSITTRQPTFKGVAIAQNGNADHKNGYNIAIYTSALSDCIVKAGDGINAGEYVGSCIAGKAGIVDIGENIENIKQEISSKDGINAGIYFDTENDEEEFLNDAMGRIFSTNLYVGEVKYDFSRDIFDKSENASYDFYDPLTVIRTAGDDPKFIGFCVRSDGDNILKAYSRSASANQYDTDEVSELLIESLKYLFLDSAGNPAISKDDFVAAGWDYTFTESGNEYEYKLITFAELKNGNYTELVGFSWQDFFYEVDGYLRLPDVDKEGFFEDWFTNLQEEHGDYVVNVFFGINRGDKYTTFKFENLAYDSSLKIIVKVKKEG